MEKAKLQYNIIVRHSENPALDTAMLDVMGTLAHLVEVINEMQEELLELEKGV